MFRGTNMSRIEKVLIGITLGAICPLLGFLALWWANFVLFPKKIILPLIIAGFVTGMLIDVVYLKKWVDGAYSVSLKIWMAVYVFYSIGILGVFMGIPVFNVVLALPAGLYSGCRMVRGAAGADEVKRMITSTCVFTTSVLAVVCLLSAILALLYPYTGRELAMMFGLQSEVTRLMLVTIVAIGGLTLLLLQWSVTAAVIRRTFAAVQTNAGLPLRTVAK